MHGDTAAAPIAIRHELRPGDLGRVVTLHAVVYGREHGWGTRFEAYVAETIGRFGAGGAVDRLWLAEREGRLVGCIGIVDAPDSAAQLRWFLVDASARGVGLGRRLLELALAHCRSCGRERVFLLTAPGLEAAARRYRAAGFELVARTTVPGHGHVGVEERYELVLRRTSVDTDPA
jgi:GNAT superfamily N-acetyltransferase